MATVDERVVEMTFKGTSFLDGVKQTITALSNLKNSLNGLKGSSKDINDLDSAGKSVDLSHIANSVDSIKSKFNLMHVAALTAFKDIVDKAVNAGLSVVKAFTIAPIVAGFQSYETKINAIQTILANTAKAGTTLDQVTSALVNLNKYANLTVYNFADMAKNIGTFTAAGVGLQTSVSSIKGIANLAALSGSSAEQASTGMYQLSQAIAAGTLKLQDYNSVVNAGFGGKVFQTALLQTAKVNGVAVDSIIKKYGSFRQALQSGFITSKILTETLSEFTGDLSTKQLEAMGFTAAESAAIEKQAAIAVKSATQIRTISQLTDALKDDVSTAYAAVFEAIIGNFSQAPKLLTSVFNVLSNALIAPIYSLAKLITAFNGLGGRTIVINTIISLFHSLGQILGTIGDAFRTVFPPTSASDLIKIALAFQRFVDALSPSKKTLDDLKDTFTGIFSVIKLGIDIVGDIVKTLAGLFKVASGGGSNFLDLTAEIGNFLTKMKNTIESGGALTKFFQVLGNVLAVPIKIVAALSGALGGLGGVVSKIDGVVAPFVQKIGAAFGALGQAVVSGLQSGNLSQIGNVLNDGIFATILLQIKKFIKNLGQSDGESGGGFFSTIKESFEGLTATLKTMQTNLKSGTLEKIAIAVALLTASLLALSFVNVANLTKSLTAITVLFTELIGAMSVVAKVAGSAGILKMAAIGVALNLLATAILILSGAVAILAQFSFDQLAKGLGAIAILLVELVTATLLMSADSKGILTSAYSMEVMATALNVLSLAVIRLGKLNLETLSKGIGAIAALLLILGAFSKFSGDTLISSAASLVLVGAALVIISSAVAKLGSLSLSTLAKGIAGIAAVLLILVVALNGMEAALPGAAALVIASAALLILSNAINNLGSESWTEIGKALVLLAASLLIIIAAMVGMELALPGAAALLVVSAALAILTPVLIALGSLSWESIAKGLATLAGVFVILAAGALLLTPVVGTLILLGAAIALIGVGVLAAGVGIGLFAVGLGALALAVTASGAAILSFVSSILSLIPLAATKLGEGVIAFANAIGGSVGAIENAFTTIMVAVLGAIIKVVPLAVKAFGTILDGFLTAVNQNAPKILTTFANLILQVLQKMAVYYPKFVTAGLDLIVNLLNGITKEIPKIASAATNMIIAFINAIGTSTVKVVNAGLTMVVNLINGIANAIRSHTPQLNAAASNLASAIIEGLVKGIAGGLAGVVNAIVNVAESAISAAEHALHINSPSKDFVAIGESTGEGTILGVENTRAGVVDSVVTTAKTMVSAFGDALSGINESVGDMLDLQPKITPVVDLTQVKQGFGQIGSLTKGQLIAATASLSSASSISAANAAAAASLGVTGSPGATVQFNQYNSSPTALSAADIYRKTKSQLSVAKGVLAGANAG